MMKYKSSYKITTHTGLALVIANMIDGEVFTNDISLSGMYYNNLTSYLEESPSIETQTALTDVEILYPEKDVAEKLRYKSHAFCYIYSKSWEITHAQREKRLQLAEMSGEIEAIEVIEKYREKLIYNNPLDSKTQQLVHFALLIGGMHKEPALLHAKAALKAGASIKELFGVCETAAVTGGMPAFSMAVDCVFEANRTL